MTGLPLSVGTGHANKTGRCPRCGQAIKPPRTDRNSADCDGLDPDYIPMCFTCKTRPCEGWSAYCHECQCAGQRGGEQNGDDQR